MCLPKILFLVFMFAFIFSLPLGDFHLAGRDHFSFSHRRYEIPMCFFHRNFVSFVLITRSNSFSVIHG